jgi:hypothetical protein
MSECPYCGDRKEQKRMSEFSLKEHSVRKPYNVFSFEQYTEDLKKCKKILREIQRTMDTDGCYNPYNKVAWFLGYIVHEARAKLEEVEK